MVVNLNNIDDVKSFIRCTSKIDSDVIVSSGRYTVDGKSLLGLLSLNLANGVNVDVNDRGDDEHRLKRLLRDYNIKYALIRLL